MKLEEYMNTYEIDLGKEDVVFELSNLITAARLHSGMTQKELAEKMGTKQPSIARAESGEIEPSVTFLAKVAKAIGTRLVLPHFSFQEEKNHLVLRDFTVSSATTTTLTIVYP